MPLDRVEWHPVSLLLRCRRGAPHIPGRGGAGKVGAPLSTGAYDVGGVAPVAALGCCVVPVGL